MIRRPAVGAQPATVDDGPGVTHVEVPCDRRPPEATEALVRRWGRDRALPAPAVDDLCRVAREALVPDLPEGAHHLTLSLRWVDLDRVRVDLRWHGPPGALAGSAPEAGTATAPVLDEVAESWGAATDASAQWVVVDTSRRARVGTSGR
ncbi:hypothetical protein [Nocardioides caldifontis]|uniref:hypothetical protein n=1 Tax=Nocardioides caldifontis TaxID=2588938 RepID=UPI00193AAB45|nr:hypothetical protein [Nocardioides caldifontis]